MKKCDKFTLWAQVWHFTIYFQNTYIFTKLVLRTPLPPNLALVTIFFSTLKASPTLLLYWADNWHVELFITVNVTIKHQTFPPRSSDHNLLVLLSLRPAAPPPLDCCLYINSPHSQSPLVVIWPVWGKYGHQHSLHGEFVSVSYSEKWIVSVQAKLQLLKVRINSIDNPV